jgi:hypothetical protein
MQAKVPVGPATYAGYGATVVGLVATGLAVVFNVDQEQAAVIAGATWTVVSFAITQIGRYAQARDAAKVGPTRSSWGVTSAGLTQAYTTAMSQMGVSNPLAYVGSTTTTPRPSADVMKDNALDPEPPSGPDKSLADPALDDPEHGVETREQHTGLKG